MSRNESPTRPSKPTGRQIRKTFLEFFRARGHEILPSSSLVPQNDPTLLFTNAGMVQFKDVFVGAEKRSYTRASTAQKCLRISGKHNDLENVGRTSRHHTFFEMLGNFSFGDYFKKEAIRFAWDLLTDEKGYALPADRMWVSVFREDDEAYAIWREQIGVPAKQIYRGDEKDNFWAMGETGPCGPCSEIGIDRGERYGEPNFAENGERFLEIWNLVFMQFERKRVDDGFTMEKLPRPSIDTGMGLERLTAILQGFETTFDTDLLRPLVDLAGKIAGKPYGKKDEDDVSMRVIADHARATAFLIADGVFPDKTGREYVLRRVIRRAVRHGHRLGIGEPFLDRVAADVVERMGEDHPELRERRAVILEVTRQEEERFRATLEKGLRLIETNQEWRYEGEKRVLPGDVAFRLYDTFGFPLDLVEIIGAERGFGVDQSGFDAALERQRERSVWKGSGDRKVGEGYLELLAEVGGGGVKFLGYDKEQADAEVVALLRGGESVREVHEGESVEVVTAETPFYGEAGGQVGDRGAIVGPKGRVVVEDTQKPVSGIIVQRGKVQTGSVKVGDRVRLEVDTGRRTSIRRNHSATHLLHWALRSVLGPHAQQKGSLVAPDRLRFDYSHFAPLGPDDLARIEDLVNEKVLVNAEVETQVTSFEEARKKGAIAIFEEKYGDVVRVVRITNDSVELCGGTHARRSGDLGLFKIVSESGIAAGVRRIEAQTGAGALDWVRRVEGELRKSAGLLRGAPLEAAEKVERMLAREKDLEKQIDQLRQKVAGGEAEALVEHAKDVGGVRAVAAVVGPTGAEDLRTMADKLRDKLKSGVVFLASADGKFIVACTASVVASGKLKAGVIAGAIAKAFGGKGGGRPDLAQGGGLPPDKLDAAREKFYDIVSAQVR